MVLTDSILFVLFNIVGAVLTLFISIVVFFGNPLREVYDHLSFKTVIVVVLAYLTGFMVKATMFYQRDDMFTSFIYNLEGSFVSIFQSFSNPLLDIYFVFSYLILYTVLLVMTYLVLHSVTDGKEVSYVGAYLFLMFLAIPFFYFLPVEVTGYYLVSVDPVIYEYNSVIGNGLKAVDTLTKALPSMHTGFSVLAMLYSFRYTGRYRWFAGFCGFSVIFSTFYLGVHWVIDAILGAFLAWVSFYLVDDKGLAESITPEEWKQRVYIFADEIRMYKYLSRALDRYE